MSVTSLRVFTITVLVVVTFALCAHAAQILRERDRRAHARCGGCGYPVTGVLGKVTQCPECGANFEEVGIKARVDRRESLRDALVVLAIPIPLWAILLLVSKVLGIW